MYRSLEVKSHVGITEGCSMSFRADEQAADFLFAGSGETFEFGFDVAALRQFLEVGAEALRQIESAAESS